MGEKLYGAASCVVGGPLGESVRPRTVIDRPRRAEPQIAKALVKE